MKLTLPKLLAFVFLAVSLCHRVAISHAQDISLVVSPPRTDLEIKPGETLQKTIKVTNTSATELILGAQTIDFIVSDDAGTPIKVTTEASGRFLASPWFTLETSELVVPPKETATLTVIITALIAARS
jgi:hypothetical protein